MRAPAFGAADSLDAGRALRARGDNRGRTRLLPLFVQRCRRWQVGWSDGGTDGGLLGRKQAGASELCSERTVLRDPAKTGGRRFSRTSSSQEGTETNHPPPMIAPAILYRTAVRYSLAAVQTSRTGPAVVFVIRPKRFDIFKTAPMLWKSQLGISVGFVDQLR